MEIVPCQKPYLPSSIQQILKVILDLGEAATERKGNGDVRAFCKIDMGKQMGKQWIVFALDKGCIVGEC